MGGFDQATPRLLAYENKVVVVGIRPEHLRWTPAVSGFDDGLTMDGVPAQVEGVESHGDSLVVYFRPVNRRGTENEMTVATARTIETNNKAAAQGSQLLGARLDAATRIALGQTVTLDADVRRLHWFDPCTGENIGLEESASRDAWPSQGARLRATETHTEGCHP
jgi:ABC-type sugar transport system ATPase subunit